MTITTEVEVSPEAAQLALKRGKGLLHIWAPLVRAIARNPKLKVALTGGAPCTDGETVWLRIPIELGMYEHDKAMCGKWDESKNQFFCPACQAELDCDMALFHEVSHILAGSFSHDDPDAELIALLGEYWPKVDWDLRALSLAGTGAAPNKSNTLVQRLAEKFPDQWGFFAFNAVEDVYVNASITEARKGLVLIFASFYEKVMSEGIRQDDGSVQTFNTLHPFIQACAAWSLIASGQSEVTKHLDPEVVDKVKGSTLLMELASQIRSTDSLVDRFKVSTKLLLEMERIGLMVREPEPEPEPEPSPGEGEPDEDGEPSGDGESGEGESSGEAEADPDGSETGDGGAPSGGVEAEVDKTDSPLKAPEGSGDEPDPDGADEAKNGGSGEPEAGDCKPDGKGDGGEESGDESTHGESSERADGAEGDTGDEAHESGGDSGSSGNGAPEDLSKPSDTDGKDKFDHDAPPSEKDGDVGVPSIEEARDAFKALTGHDDFGDEDAIEEALDATPDIDEDDEPTELIEAALSFDGVLDHIDGNLHKAIMSGLSSETNLRSDLFGGKVKSRYDLPTEIMVPAAQRMRLAFAHNKDVGMTRGLTSGRRLDAKSMGYRIPAGDDRIFARRDRPKKRDWSVLIGIDVSASARSGAIEIEKQVAIGVGDLLDQLGIPFSMYAHTGVSASGHRGYNLIIAPLKTERQLWKGPARHNACSLRTGAANLDGHTMQAYRKLLEGQRGKDKLLLYFTDGSMPCENGAEERRILVQECALMKAKGMHTIGVGVGCDDPKRYGLDTIEVNGSFDIPKLLQGVGQRLTR